MSDEMLHPTPDRFEAYLEDSLDDAERAVLESHLRACARCEGELDEWRTLFAVLRDLPRLEPRPGFAERVMAGVRIRQPWHVRLLALVERLAPHSTGGWSMLVAILALPMLTLGGGAFWLFSQSWMTAEGLFLFLRQRSTDALLTLVGQAGSTVLETSAASWIITQVQAVAPSLGPGEIGAIAAAFGTLTVVSAWVLYENLFRTPTRDTGYASYSF